MRYTLLGVVALFLCAGLSDASAEALGPQPISLEGKCAKEAGAPYDPVRDGWYTQNREQAKAYRDCLHRRLTGTYIVASLAID